jgi:hypothetical protein
MTSRRFTAGYLAPTEEPSADVRKYVGARLGSTLRADTEEATHS